MIILKIMGGIVKPLSDFSPKHRALVSSSHNLFLLYEAIPVCVQFSKAFENFISGFRAT